MKNIEAIHLVWEKIFFSDILDEHPDLGYDLYLMVKENGLCAAASVMEEEALKFTNDYFDRNEIFPANTWQGKVFTEVSL